MEIVDGCLFAKYVKCPLTSCAILCPYHAFPEHSSRNSNQLVHTMSHDVRLIIPELTSTSLKLESTTLAPFSY